MGGTDSGISRCTKCGCWTLSGRACGACGRSERRTTRERPPARVRLLDAPRAGWQQHAACATSDVDPDAWFEHPDTVAGRSAIAVCHGCDVRADCLTHAVDTREEYGIWGGYGQGTRARWWGRGTP